MLNSIRIFGLHWQEAIFKVNTVKKVGKIHMQIWWYKWCLKYGNDDNIINQKVKKV